MDHLSKTLSAFNTNGTDSEGEDSNSSSPSTTSPHLVASEQVGGSSFVLDDDDRSGTIAIRPTSIDSHEARRVATENVLLKARIAELEKESREKMEEAEKRYKEILLSSMHYIYIVDSALNAMGPSVTAKAQNISDEVTNLRNVMRDQIETEYYHAFPDRNMVPRFIERTQKKREKEEKKKAEKKEKGKQGKEKKDKKDQEKKELNGSIGGGIVGHVSSVFGTPEKKRTLPSIATLSPELAALTKSDRFGRRTPSKNQLLTQELIEAKKIVGIEIDKYFHDLQQQMVSKYSMDDRVELVHGDIMLKENGALLDRADVIYMNNVMEFFESDKIKHIAFWKVLMEHTGKKKGMRIVTIPSIQETFKQSKLGLSIKGWLKETVLHAPEHTHEDLHNAETSSCSSCSHREAIFESGSHTDHDFKMGVILCSWGCSGTTSYSGLCHLKRREHPTRTPFLFIFAKDDKLK
eukprot:gene12008-14039_t